MMLCSLCDQSMGSSMPEGRECRDGRGWCRKMVEVVEQAVLLTLVETARPAIRIGPDLYDEEGCYTRGRWKASPFRAAEPLFAESRAESEKESLPCSAKSTQDRRRAGGHRAEWGSRFGTSQERVMFWRCSHEKLYSNGVQTRYRWGQMQEVQLRRKLELLRAELPVTTTTSVVLLRHSQLRCWSCERSTGACEDAVERHESAKHLIMVPSPQTASRTGTSSRLSCA